MNVPILKFFGYPINKAIGGCCNWLCNYALFGAAGFLISGSFLKANLPLSVGFLNIPAFLIFFFQLLLLWPDWELKLVTELIKRK